MFGCDDRELVEGVEDLGTISDINVTPFIDIMLVLLIIFMVTAPLMLGGVNVNLPKTGGDPMAQPENPTIVSLDASGQVFVDKLPLSLEEQTAQFKKMAQESETGEVFVRGDGEVKYAKMMELMAALGQLGFARVTLVTDIRAGKTGGAAEPEASSLVAPAPESSPAPLDGASSAPITSVAPTAATSANPLPATDK